MTNKENLRPLPQSDLDLNLMLTDSVWGKAEVSPELREILSQYFVERDDQGQPLKGPNGELMVKKSSLWGMLGFFTRDMRLANLSHWDNELQTCRYMIDLANDFLQMNMVQPFLISLSRAACILETSQSKGGFFRRISNTLRQESVQQTLDPPKKGFFGGKKEKQGGY